MTDFNIDLAAHGIEIAAKNLSVQVDNNAEIIQTKATGAEPSTLNSVARFADTSGTTIQSSDVVVDNNNNVGIGTVSPSYKVDIRTPNTKTPQIHITEANEDSGGYLVSAGASSATMLGGLSIDTSIYKAKATQAGAIGTLFGITTIAGDTGLTPGNTYTPTELLRVGYADANFAATDPTIVTNVAYTRLAFPVVGLGAPTFTNRSAGARIILYPLMSASTTDVAIGAENNTFWFGHLDNNSARLFKWYGGETEVMRLQADGLLKVKAGGATGFANVGGAVFDHFVDASNSGTAETDLYTDTLPAGAFNTNGDKLLTTYQLQCTGAALASQDMRVYFGGTKIYDSGALSIGAITSNFTFEVTVIRVSATVVRCSVAVSSDFATLFPYSAYTEVTGLTLTNAQIFKVTGQASGASGASNQITAKMGCVLWYPQS